MQTTKENNSAPKSLSILNNTGTKPANNLRPKIMNMKELLNENELLQKENANANVLIEMLKEEIGNVRKMNDLLKITQDMLLDRAGFDKTGKPRLLDVPYGRLQQDKKSKECLVVAFRSSQNQENESMERVQPC